MKSFSIYIVSFMVFFMLFTSTTITQWTHDPTVNNAISTAVYDQRYPTIISDGLGGVIITWQDRRSGGGNYDVYTQRVNSAGVAQWTANGIAVSTAVNSQTSPKITTDGSGGAIITWKDFRNGAFNAIYAQRVNSAGVVQWTADGLAIATAVNSQDYPTIVSDDSGGAIIAWSDYRSGAQLDIYAQRINSAGVVQWTTAGVAISTEANHQDIPAIVSDGSGGAIITWQEPARCSGLPPESPSQPERTIKTIQRSYPMARAVRLSHGKTTAAVHTTSTPRESIVQEW